MPDEFQIKTSGKVAVIFPSGELRRDSTEPLWDAVDIALENNAEVIILSFEQVDALLSEGIRMLIATNDKVVNAGKAFHIVDLPPEVFYTLQITNLLEFLNHVESLDDILREFDLTLSDLEELRSSMARLARRHPPSPPPKPKAADDSQKIKLGESLKKSRESETTEAVDHKKDKAKRERVTLTEDQMRGLIKKHMPGRLAVEIVDYYVRRRANVADLKSLVEHCGHKEKVVLAMAQELVQRQVLQSMGGGTFNYAPDHDLRLKLECFFRNWHNRSRQPKMLAMLLAAER